MSRFIQIIIASLVFCSCTSQKNTRVYAYRQPVFQGARPVGVVDEKGKEVETQIRERANFFIYLETPASNIEFKEMWIKRKAYAVNAGLAPATPIVIEPQVKISGGDTLVRATNNRVMQLSPGLPIDAAQPSEQVQKMINENELVIHCVVNGKDKYYPLATIKNLPPVALQ